jgi:hypothetical protein
VEKKGKEERIEDEQGGKKGRTEVGEMEEDRRKSRGDRREEVTLLCCLPLSVQSDIFLEKLQLKCVRISQFPCCMPFLSSYWI